VSPLEPPSPYIAPVSRTTEGKGRIISSVYNILVGALRLHFVTLPVCRLISLVISADTPQSVAPPRFDEDRASWQDLEAERAVFGIPERSAFCRETSPCENNRKFRQLMKYPGQMNYAYISGY